MMSRLVLVLSFCCATAAPALADIPPGPPPRPTTRLVRAPDEVLRVIGYFAEALKTKDVSKARVLTHERGWRENLVGGSGQAMEDTFREGAREGWTTREVVESQQAVGGAWIVSADIVSGEGRVLDRVDLLFVKVGDRWRILGAGKKREQVVALALRFAAGQELAPPPVKPE